MKTTLLFLLSLLLVGSLPTEGALPSSIFTGCSNTTTCFMVRPTSCNTECTGPDCNLVAIIENIPSQNKFRIRLYSDQNYGYMAVGFSLDNMMDFSDVVGCDRSSNTVANPKDTYNVFGRANQYDTDQSAISNFSFNISGNNFSCTFDRDYQPAINSNGYILNSRSYILFLGARSANQFSAANSRFERHAYTPCISGSAVDLLNPSPVISTGRNFAPVIAHGLLMVFAWQVLIVIGVFIASYTKYIFPNGEWFQAHRFINSFAILIAVISFILIFATVREWSSGSNYVWGHQIFGISAMFLMLLNPVLAVFRCRPRAEYRWIFYLLHGGAGLFAIIFASVALELGFFIFYEFNSIPLSRAVGLWIFIVWIITVWFFYVPLIVYRSLKNKKIQEDEKSMAKEDLPEVDPFNLLFHNITGIPLCPPKDKRKEPAKEWPVIGAVLTAFIVHSLVFYIACVIALALAS